MISKVTIAQYLLQKKNREVALQSQFQGSTQNPHYNILGAKKRRMILTGNSEKLKAPKPLPVMDQGKLKYQKKTN